MGGAGGLEQIVTPLAAIGGKKGKKGVLDDVFGIEDPGKPPPPPELPPPVSEVDIEQAKTRKTRRLRGAAGRRSTIVASKNEGQKKTVLG